MPPEEGKQPRLKYVLILACVIWQAWNEFKKVSEGRQHNKAFSRFDKGSCIHSNMLAVLQKCQDLNSYFPCVLSFSFTWHITHGIRAYTLDPCSKLTGGIQTDLRHIWPTFYSRPSLFVGCTVVEEDCGTKSTSTIWSLEFEADPTWIQPTPKNVSHIPAAFLFLLLWSAVPVALYCDLKRWHRGFHQQEDLRRCRNSKQNTVVCYMQQSRCILI